eukprot:3255445-Rhodomonas_salina.2
MAQTYSDSKCPSCRVLRDLSSGYLTTTGIITVRHTRKLLDRDWEVALASVRWFRAHAHRKQMWGDRAFRAKNQRMASRAKE